HYSLLMDSNILSTLAGTCFSNIVPTTIYTIVETITGSPISSPSGSSTFFVTIKVNRPAAMEDIAALGPQDLNAGNTPKSSGTAIGPTKAPNQDMISPKTPPNRSYWKAMI